MENTALCLLEDTPSGLLTVDIIDFANRPNFPCLNQLKSLNLCRIWLNEQTSIQAFDELEMLIQHRFHNLFINGEMNLNEYNSHSIRPEKYHLLIINTAYFPTESLSAQRLQNFIKSAYSAGIYIIALHNTEQVIENHQKSLQALLSNLTSIQIDDSLTALQIDEKLLPVEKMAKVGGFTFALADVNQTQILTTLKSELTQAQDDGSTNFLRIPIGQKVAGDTAYLELGDKSQNYSVVLLGVPGSGKSNLMNNIITQIAKDYHAGQIQLYLLDFAGVEFGQFKHNPNVERIFLDVGEPKKGIAFLEELQTQMRQRQKLLEDHSFKSISEYNNANPEEPLHHIIVMIDEFQRLFQGDYRHQEQVNDFLTEIIREWRKFGIYLFLCTQTLQDVPMKKSLINLLGLKMSFRVTNEATLGYDMFKKENTPHILQLNKYEIFAESVSGESFQAYVNPPIKEPEKIFNKARLSRPAHLQTQAKVFYAKKQIEAENNQITAQPKENIQTAEIQNPNQLHFERIDQLIAQAKQALGNVITDDADTPDWLQNNKK